MDKKVGSTRKGEELKPGTELSSRNAHQNFSLQGEKLSPPVIKNAREVFGEPEKNQEILVSMGEQPNPDTIREETNAKKRKPEPSVQGGEPLILSTNQVESKRMRACFEHTSECQRNKALVASPCTAP